MLQISEKDRDAVIHYIRNSVPTSHTVNAVLEIVQTLAQLKEVPKKKKKK